MSASSPLAIIGAVLLFILFWCTAWYLFSLFGWRSLADQYHTLKKPPVTMYNFCAGLMNGFLKYSGFLRIGLDPHGLYLAVWPICVHHPPLFIPWSDVGREQRSWFFWKKFLIGNPTIASLHLSSTMASIVSDWRTNHRAAK